MRSLKLVFTAFIAILLCSNCAKDGDTGPEGPAGPSLTGDMVGFVTLTDINGKRLSDFSGVKISIEGKDITATSAADGRFKLTGVSTGTYTIAVSKAGYCDRKSVSLQFVGGGEYFLGTYSLYQIPNMKVTNLAVNVSASSELVNITGSIEGDLPSVTRNVRIYINPGNTVSSDPQKYVYITTAYMNGTTTTFSAPVYFGTLAYYGINAGQSFSVVAYGESYSSSSYTDIATGKYIYTSLNSTPSNVVTTTY
jgi:hypothetical protein